MTYLFLRVDLASGCSLGPSRTAILEGIDRYGSLSASARSVGLTYRQVWNTVQLLNKVFPEPLVSVKAGGPSSGASLTPLGKKLIARFRAMEADAAKALKNHLKAFERMLGEDPKAPSPVPRWAQSLPSEAAAAKPKPKPVKVRAPKRK